MNGPTDPNAEETECPVCGAVGEFVLVDHDSVCENCGNVNGAIRNDEDLTEWEQWWQHRRNSNDYVGWTGHNRIKFVGGFASTYQFGEDFN